MFDNHQKLIELRKQEKDHEVGSRHSLNLINKMNLNLMHRYCVGHYLSLSERVFIFVSNSGYELTDYFSYFNLKIAFLYENQVFTKLYMCINQYKIQ